MIRQGSDRHFARPLGSIQRQAKQTCLQARVEPYHEQCVAHDQFLNEDAKSGALHIPEIGRRNARGRADATGALNAPASGLLCSSVLGLGLCCFDAPSPGGGGHSI